MGLPDDYNCRVSCIDWGVNANAKEKEEEEEEESVTAYRRWQTCTRPARTREQREKEHPIPSFTVNVYRLLSLHTTAYPAWPDLAYTSRHCHRRSSISIYPTQLHLRATLPHKILHLTDLSVTACSLTFP